MAGVTGYPRLMAAGGSANDAFLDAITAAVDTLDTYVARVNAGAVIAAGDNTTFKMQGLNGPTVAGASRTVKILGRIGSEDQTFLDALNAIATTFAAYRTAVNANAAIVSGDTTCYKVQDVNGAAVSGATVFYRSTSRFDTDLDDLETQINGMVDALSQFVSAWNLKQGGTPTTLVVSTVKRLRPFTRPSDGVEDTTRNIAIDGGNSQSAAVVTQPTTAFTVLVTDSTGTAVAGAQVTWATSTGGSITSSSLTNASGIASATPTTGEVAQTETYTATTSSGQSVSFTLTATAGTAANIAAASTQDQSALTSAAVSAPPSVLITDAYGNPKSGTTVTFTVTAGGGTRDPATVNSASSTGLATLTSWTLGGSAGLNTLTATAAGLAGSPVTFNANAVAAAPTQIAVQSGGSQTGIVAGQAATATVFRVRDAGSSPVQGVTVAFTITTGNGSLSVASAVTDVNGDASVTYTTDELVETATIKGAFTNAAGTEVSASTTIASTFGAANKLAIQTQPSSNGSSGTALSQQPIILIQDANGNTVTNSTATVTASVQSGNATITAGSTKAAVAGVATFSGLTMTDTDSGANVLRFSSGALTVVDSGNVTLAPPVPVALQFAGPISGVVEDTGILNCSVLVVDNTNTTVPGATDAVAVALTSAGGATLSGDLTVNAVAGVASFGATEALTINNPGTYSLTATSGTLTSAVSNSFTISAVGSGEHPNEPAGMTLLTDQPWDAVPAVNTPDAYGWYRTRTGSQSIVVDATAPMSPSNVLSMNFGQNLSGGTAPLDIVKAISGTARKRLYCHFALFLPTNWTNSGNSGTKFFFVAQHSNTNHLVDLVRGGTGTGNMMSMITQHNGNGSLGQEVSGGFTGASANRNRWLDVEIMMLANTPGTSNGEYHVWLDGVKRATHTNLLYFLTGQTPYWNAIRINPTYGGGSGQPPAGGLAVKVDHFYASVANS